MKFKSKSLISIILSIMMVISMILVAIPANAAVVDNVSVGADTYYIWYNTQNNNAITSSGAWSYAAMNTSDNGTTYYYEITSEGQNIFVNFNQSDSSAIASSSIWPDDKSAGKAVTDNSTVVTSVGGQNYGSYNFLRLYAANGATFRITYSPSLKTVVLSDVSSDPPESTVASSTTPVSTTSWYLVGGNSDGPFGGVWDATTNKNYPLDETYSGNSNVVCRTVTFTKETYFRFSDGSKTYFSGENGVSLRDSSNKITLVEYSDSLGNGAFKATPQTIKICLDTSSKQVWYETATEPTTTEPVETTVPPTTVPSGAYKITDATTDLNGSLSFSASGGTAAGTANLGDTVTITGNPVKSYFELDTVTVTGEDKTDIKVSGTGNIRTFTMPEQNVTAKATFKLNKSAYIQSLNEDGLWIDIAPEKYDTTATLIKWNNYTGSNHGTNSYYTFYVPKNVDLSQAQIYNGFNSEVKLNNVSISAHDMQTVSLTAGKTYNSGNDNTHSVKVMQGSTNAMFLHTTDNTGADYDLPTTIDSKLTTKSKVETSGGLCTTMVLNSDGTSTISSAMALDTVKGRGNSSWEASYKFFGKYAFNMKLAKKTNLFNIDTTKLPDDSKPSGSKSWCLLANNADESMLRNALTYQLASEIGLLYSPEFSFVDIYDNGEYLGQYLVTEKVDIGSSKLIKGNSFEDINEDAVKAATGNTEATIDKTTKTTTYSYTYANNTNYTPAMRYANVAPNGATSDKNKYPYDNTATDPAKQGKYLLEFEISDRVNDEPCYFVSPQGQNVVVKSPEYATKEQVEFIAKKFAKMEEVAFTANASKSDLSNVMDVESFAKMYLIQEFTANLDAASTSYYITFDCSQTNPVFVANPVWDYDMALGQFGKTDYKYEKGGKKLSPASTDAWLAKYKRMDNSEWNAPDKYSIQSQLASQNSAFKTEIRKQWEGTNGFNAKIQKYIGDNGQIKKTWFDNINASVEMNEARWGFIANDLLIVNDWGLKNTGANHTAAVNYLNKWVTDRASWLNGEFTKNAEYAPYTPSKPTIAAFNADLSATITSPINAGSDFVIRVTSEIESGVKYRLYEGASSDYLENSNGVFALKATAAGKKTYTVKAVYGTTESEVSDSVSVTVIAPADLEGVSLSVSNTSVNVNEEFTLTAKASPAGVTGVTYTFYKGSTAIATDVTSNTLKTKLTAEGSAEYTVTATANGITVTSNSVTVTATKVEQVHDFTVYFKCASAPAYKPYVSLDGATAVAMTQGTELGKNYAGTLTFYWYSYTFKKVDSADTHTLKFTSKKTKLNATITDNFANSEYYLAVDNLMTGTEVVDLTGSLVYVRNFFHSATNMVYSGVGTDKTLGFTNINGTRYKMGTYIDDNGLATFSVKSATTMQMLTAELTTVSETQQAILDVNLDGKVDIKDATLMQRALVS